MKNLIIASISNYSLNQIKPFFESLRRINCDHVIYLTISNIDEETIRYLKMLNTKFNIYNNKSVKLPFINTKIGIHNNRFAHVIYNISPLLINFVKYLFFIPRIEKFMYMLAINLHHIYTYRFIFAYLYLRQNLEDYDKVLLTDVRDVVFQDDPFNVDMEDALCCFLEDRTINIGQCKYNSQWILETYGESVLQDLQFKNISCSGITIGKSSVMLKYLELMTKEIIKLKKRTVGVDQGIHNYVIYKKMFDKVKLFENEKSSVLTMGYMNEKDIVFNENHYIMNADGSMPNIIHQYDRHKSTIVDAIIGHTDFK